MYARTQGDHFEPETHISHILPSFAVLGGVLRGSDEQPRGRLRFGRTVEFFSPRGFFPGSGDSREFF